ncbi:hypothetical protein ABL78_1031 [Leptomonas seymouri]|uniref:BAR domain-containing protein n=1 Tax=Leptomonas seymouri TaxID=5684 RepID=A0A0N1PG41_LEPSE|nr:hypothetical protein ABL78_1031 [Leptomonas seymouri]|eukprot:KPI89862.1 hypothetical protein ABL78_1031 [Leptomonas seymouri]
MPLCASIPVTSDTDLSLQGTYLTDLDNCMKSFNDSITATLNAYRNLLTAFDHVGQVFGNVAHTCSKEVDNEVKGFRNGMRDMKDTGGFETFNNEIHEGSAAVLDPVRQGLKSAKKSYKEVKARQKEYDTVRYELDKTEKSYSKKQKSLTESKGYRKNMAKREKVKELYEARRSAFNQEIEALQHTTDSLLLRSLNNYLHSTAAFCGQLEALMTSYRTDINGSQGQKLTSMDKLKKEAQDRSAVPAAVGGAQDTNRYVTEDQATQEQFDEDEVLPSQPQQRNHSGDFYPAEGQHNRNEDSVNSHSEDVSGPNPFNLNAQ